MNIAHVTTSHLHLWEWACVLPLVYLLGAGLLQKIFLPFSAVSAVCDHAKQSMQSGGERGAANSVWIAHYTLLYRGA